jgi:hypothetical protein
LRVLHADAAVLTSLATSGRVAQLSASSPAPHQQQQEKPLLDLQDFAINDPVVCGGHAQWDHPLMARTSQNFDQRIGSDEFLALLASPIISTVTASWSAAPAPAFPAFAQYRLSSVNLDGNNRVGDKAVATLCLGAFNTLTHLGLRHTVATITPRSLRALALCGRLRVLDVAHSSMPTATHIGLLNVVGAGNAQVGGALADTLAEWVSAAVPVLQSLESVDAIGAAWLGELVAPWLLNPAVAPQMRDFRSTGRYLIPLMRAHAANDLTVQARVAAFTPSSGSDKSRTTPHQPGQLIMPAWTSGLQSLTLLNGFGSEAIDGAAFFAALRHHTPHLRRLALGVPFASFDRPFGAPEPTPGLEDALHLLLHRLESFYFVDCPMLSLQFYAAWAKAAYLEETVVREDASAARHDQRWSSTSAIRHSSRCLRELHLISVFGPRTPTAAVLEAVTAIATLSLARAQAYACRAPHQHRDHSQQPYHKRSHADATHRKGLTKLSVTTDANAVAGSDPDSATGTVPELFGRLFAMTPDLEDLRLDRVTALLADDVDGVTFDIIAASLPRLRVLKVGGDRVPAGALAKIAAGIGKSLRSVAVQYSRADDGDMDALCEHCLCLEYLDVSGCSSVTVAALWRVMVACPLQFLGVTAAQFQSGR